MLHIKIPGGEDLNLHHLVTDYNGTIAEDGKLLGGVREAFEILAKSVDIIVLTADTHGSVRGEIQALPCSVEIIDDKKQDCAKRDCIIQLGADSVAAIGNGRNDMLMLQEAALGICLIQAEGCSSQTIASADVVCTSVIDALNMLLIPKRITATLRN